MVISILGLQFRSKHLKRNKRKLSFRKKFGSKFLQEFYEWSKPLGREACHHNFVFPIENVVNYFCPKNKYLFSVILKPGIIFGPGTWTTEKY